MNNRERAAKISRIIDMIDEHLRRVSELEKKDYYNDEILRKLAKEGASGLIAVRQKLDKLVHKYER